MPRATRTPRKFGICPSLKGHFLSCQTLTLRFATFRIAVRRVQLRLTWAAAQILPVHAQYIEAWINSFEQVLYGMDWLHAERGYRSRIDAGSFVDYLLVAVELTNNPDSLVASVYLSKVPARLTAGQRDCGIREREREWELCAGPPAR